MSTRSQFDPIPQRFACVVGAPRCGTTSLSNYLQEHPGVSFSSVKEPHFFSRYDLSGLTDGELHRALQDDYLPRYFDHYSESRPLIAEGSVSYLYAAERMKPILRTWPEAKFIIALRDPMAMLPSLHQRLLYLGDEVVPDFATAWQLLGERSRGRSIPRTCLDPRWLQYDEIGQFGKYLERFFSVVGRERCFVSIYDDLARDPAGTYRQMLDFLDLPDDGRTDFAAHRTGQSFKIGWLQRLLKRPPMAMRSFMAGEKYRLRVKSLGGPERRSPLLSAIMTGRKALLDWNRAPAPRISLDPALRRDIRETLVADIERLSRLLDRDLSHWLAA